jgi:hypothetical protein
MRKTSHSLWSELEAFTFSKFTPLAFAIVHNNASIVSLLLRADANMHVKFEDEENRFFTPLEFAKQYEITRPIYLLMVEDDSRIKAAYAAVQCMLLARKHCSKEGLIKFVKEYFDIWDPYEATLTALLCLRRANLFLYRLLRGTIRRSMLEPVLWDTNSALYSSPGANRILAAFHKMSWLERLCQSNIFVLKEVCTTLSLEFWTFIVQKSVFFMLLSDKVRNSCTISSEGESYCHLSI